MFCNWGVLGAGFIARQAVIPAIQQSRNGRVKALASRALDRARALATEQRIERVYGDYRALLADPTLDAIYIALPNHLHCPWTIQAAQAGKHILCEKPLACTAGEGAQMVAASQQADVQLMEAAMYRFHPRWRRLKQLVEEGRAGQERFLHSSFTFTLNPAHNYRQHPAYGGGALLDVGCYCVNALCWLNNTDPVEIRAFTTRQHPDGIDLATSAVLRFANGTLGHIQCSFDAAEHQSVEFIGTTGTLTVPQAFTAWREDHTTLLFQQGNQLTQEQFTPTDPYQLMVEHFVDALDRTVPLWYPPQKAVQTLHILDQIRTQH